MKRPPISNSILAFATAALVLSASAASGANFNWINATGNWSVGGNWGGTAPSGLVSTDTLTFAGNVGTVGAPTIYTATNDIAAIPFLLNQLLLQATDPAASGNDHILAGNALRLSAAAAGIVQSGSGGFTINNAIQFAGPITFSGNGTGVVTMNQAVSGAFDITKNGTSTFRFGTVANAAPSGNTWFGGLTINAGTIRFNNNVDSAPTALRANPVTMTSSGSIIFQPKTTDPASSVRFGALSGSGLVEARSQVTAGSQDSENILIYALGDGSFSGTIRNTKIGTQSLTVPVGKLTVRGLGSQTFSGTMEVEKDLAVFGTATMKFAGSASVSGQVTGAVLLQGGRFVLDNATTNNNNRLRDGDVGSTGVDTIGGGTLSLIGNASGTTEVLSRLQLGSGGATPNSRSGAVTIDVVHNAGSGAATVLDFQSYSRNVLVTPLNTVNFTAHNGAGAVLALGQALNNPRIIFSPTAGSFTVPQFNNLLGNTNGGDATTVGWATINGTDFASHGSNGVIPVGLDSTPAASGTGNGANNVQVTGNLSLSNAAGYSLNSLKLAPATTGQAITLATAGNLITGAILLAGPRDYAINSTGGGGLASSGGTGPRYFQVQQAVLTLGASLGATIDSPVVKGGAGTLALTNSGNLSVTAPLVINSGVVRGQPGLSLPAGEIRFRGGVLELTGGGTFGRSVGFGTGMLTWSGVDNAGAAIGEERGSGGFSAFGAAVTVDLGAAGPTSYAWEDLGFVDSGFALIFGSTTATARVTFADNISLSQIPVAGDTTPANYNAREFRAIDNPGSAADRARLSGSLSGTVQNDFLKTGDGFLELTGTNTYLGATLIHQGAMVIDGSIISSFLTDVRSLAQLMGRGSVGNVKVENGGDVAPGDAPGLASILSTKDITFDGGPARLTLEIGGPTAGGDGSTGYDQINVTGGITLNGATLELFSLGGFTASPGQLYFILQNDGVDPVAGFFAQGNSVAFGAQIFSISYTANAEGTPAFTGGNDIALLLVPEPASAALLSFGALALAARRRRA